MCGCDKKEEMILIADDNAYDQADSESIIMEADALADENDNKREALDDINNPELSFVVFVCGEVLNPGVYELDGTPRLIDAIEAAGGYTEKAAIEYLNLARDIKDGEKIYVPNENEILADSGAKTVVGMLENDGSYVNNNSTNGLNTGENTMGNLVNINVASEAELKTLPGVGESKAKAIIAYREEHGGFKKKEDLMKISGIKDGLFNKVKDNICVN